jgi:hypothetical protein
VKHLQAFLLMLDEMPPWARVLLAICFMLGAAILTLAVFWVAREEDAPLPDTTTPTAQLIGQFPLVLQTAPPPTATHSPTPEPSLTATATFPSATPTITLTPSPTLTPRSTITPPPPITIAAFVPTATEACHKPDGWVEHTVVAGETLFAFQLGTNSTVTVDQIMEVNCLTDRLIYENQVIYLPEGAAENAPSSQVAPTPFPTDPNAPPPPAGLSRTPRCPCQITLPAGWRLEQIAELIDSLPLGFSGKDFLAVTGKGVALPDREFLRGLPAGASLEGYMFPLTYTVTNEMDARAFVSMVLDAFGAVTGSQLWADAAARDLTPYDAVTLASIIVRESGSYNQQILISSVFHNRLKTGRGLAATVTTQYALGRPGDWWPNAQGYVSSLDSPYNTNLYTGLPPSPIASPSLDALRAAVYPADTNYLYFTAACDGSGNAYAETYDQHLANVRCEG